MASSKVMASTTPSNPDLPRQSSLHSLADQSRSFGSMNIDELLKNIYSDGEPFSADNGSGEASLTKSAENKRVDEVWKEIVEGKEPEMTLEDFLTKAGAVREEDSRIAVLQLPLGFGADPMMNASQFQAPASFAVDTVGFGSGIDGRVVTVAGGDSSGVGRGKRRAAEESPMDKATQQKQRRMIKNRESAARSRERKQAYTVELEVLVMQLEEENSRLVREEAERSRERVKKLMENLIPVVEKQRPPRALGRTHSMGW